MASAEGAIVAARSRTRPRRSPGTSTDTSSGSVGVRRERVQLQLRSAVEATTESSTSLAVLDAGGGRGAGQRLARRAGSGDLQAVLAVRAARTAAGWRSASLLIALVPLIDTAMIWMFKVVVDEVLVPQDFGPFVWIARAYVGLTILAGVLGFFDDFLANWIGERLPARPPHQVLRPPAGALARLLRSPAPRRPDLAPDRRHRLDRGVRALRRDGRDLLPAPHRLLQRRALLPAVGSRADLAAGRAALLAGGEALLAADQGRLAREAAPQRLDQLGGRGEPLERRARPGLRAGGQPRSSASIARTWAAITRRWPRSG